MYVCGVYTELLLKMGELCGTSVSLRCQLPTEDLDALVSITCDEDLANLIEEYDRAASPPSNLKIRAFLSPPKSIKKISSPPSSASSSSSTYTASSSTPRSLMPVVMADRCLRQISPPVVPFRKSTGKNISHCAYHAHGNTGHIYLIHSGNHWR